MSGSPSKPLSKDDMYALFETLSERLRRKGARANIYLVGGAVMALAFDRERITGDIDARIDTGHGALVEAVHEIAAERGLATNWLNEQAVSAIPKTPDARAPTLYATQYLVVTGASAEHMLAMKLEAGRGRDVSDIATLVRMLGLRSPEEGVAIHRRLLPNAVRVAGINDGEGETLFDRRGSTLSWVVPVDDTRCFSIGWSDIDKELAIPGRTGYVDRQSRQGAYVVGAGDVGQTGAPAYEERQRAPGDWDAWVSQGPVTLHSREHLGTTDRGVIMYRKLVRQGIRAVAEGNAPKGLQFEGTGERPTCCNNTVARIPAPADPEADRRLRIAFGREVTKRILAGEYSKEEPGCADPRGLEEIRRALA